MSIHHNDRAYASNRPTTGQQSADNGQEGTSAESPLSEKQLLVCGSSGQGGASRSPSSASDIDGPRIQVMPRPNLPEVRINRNNEPMW